ncbi:DUF368 domain-containing protein [Natronogracilivirga saccharolytica]|nr:DUF368 domain-containing protein [Natronogracilivirga saccharolytica]
MHFPGKSDEHKKSQNQQPDEESPASSGSANKDERDQHDLVIPENDLTQPREMPFLYLKGFAMGSADVVPGVSGGTMSLILGIYTRLIFAIKSVDLKAVGQLFTLQWAELFERVHWKFLISVFLGGVSAVFFFTTIVALPVLMHTRPEVIYGLFFGLISGSILLLLKAIGDVGWKELLIVFAGVGIGFRIVTLVPTDTPETSLFVFLSGSLSITAMVLPGISGSFILLILRKYEYILSHIALLPTDRFLEALSVLFPFGLGMVVGLVLFVRLLSWLLKRFHILTLCLLVGFMAGSLYVIWPFQERDYREIVESRVLPADDPLVQELKEDEPSRRRPEYSELGHVINPDAPDDEQKIEVRNVRRVLVSSSPYWPDWLDPGEDPRLSVGGWSLYGSVGTMLVGFLLVGYLGRVMNKKGLVGKGP